VQTGTKISATLHVGLVGWALLGGAFRSEPLPLEVQEVSVISAAEFEALSARPATPEVSSEPVALQQPEPAQDAPALEPAEDTPPVAEPAPEPVVVPEPEPAPVTPPPPDPTPEPEVADAPATLVPLPEVAPEPPVSAPLATLRPRSRPAERVAPTPVAPPPPDTTPDPVVREQVAEADTGDSPQEPQEATAPEAASDRIETEANQEDEQTASLAPARSVRPSARPAQRRATQPATDPAPEAPDTSRQDAIADALAQALSGEQSAAAEQAPVPTGPPLTSGERDALRLAVSNCWNVGSLSSEALRTTIVVAMSMSREGKPDVGTIRLLSSSGGSAQAANQAFEAARRAIIRCGARGYNLPVEKFAQWRDIEMTFNPERMRTR
jgi:hypothetical protein